MVAVLAACKNLVSSTRGGRAANKKNKLVVDLHERRAKTAQGYEKMLARQCQDDEVMQSLVRANKICQQKQQKDAKENEEFLFAKWRGEQLWLSKTQVARVQLQNYVAEEASLLDSIRAQAAAQVDTLKDAASATKEVVA